MVRKAEIPSLKNRAWLKDVWLQKLMAVLSEEGGDVRVVGGAVRNALMARAVADVDLATTHLPQDVMRLCKAAKFGVHPTGLDHGTITISHDRGTFEVTTLRRDVATDGRRATVAFTQDWAEDAARRDFTFNALYCSAGGICEDYTDGYRDLLNRKVKFVGDAEQRIKEDYLRILRFFRFHASYGAATPEPRGLAACIALKEGLRTLSPERVRQEFFKLLVAPRALPTLKLMARVGILDIIIPHTDEWRVFSRLPEDALLRLFVLARAPEVLAGTLRLSKVQAKRLQLLVNLPAITPAFRPREQKTLLYELGEEAYRDAVILSLARGKDKQENLAWRRLLALPKRWSTPTLPVTGDDLKALGIVSGPQLGRILRDIEDWWLASDFKPGREELLERVRTDYAK